MAEHFQRGQRVQVKTKTNAAGRIIPMFDSAPFKAGDEGRVVTGAQDGAPSCEVLFDSGITAMVAFRHLHALNKDGTVMGGETEPQGCSRQQVPSTSDADDSDDPPPRCRRARRAVVKKYVDSDDDERPARSRRNVRRPVMKPKSETTSTVETSGCSVMQTITTVEVTEKSSSFSDKTCNFGRRPVKETVDTTVENESVSLEVQRLTDLLTSAESRRSLLQQQIGILRSKLAVDRHANHKKMQENEFLRNTLADMEQKVALQGHGQEKVVETDTEISVRMKADWMQSVGTAIAELKTAKAAREKRYRDELSKLRAEFSRRQINSPPDPANGPRPPANVNGSLSPPPQMQPAGAPQSAQIPMPQGQPRLPHGEPRLPQGQPPPPHGQPQPSQVPIRPHVHSQALQSQMRGMFQSQVPPGMKAGSPFVGSPSPHGPGFSPPLGGLRAGTVQAMGPPGMPLTSH